MSTRGWFSALVAFVVMPTLLAGTALASVPTAGLTPGTVFIRTVPTLGGVHLLVGSTPVTTGSDGSATVAVASINQIATRVSLERSVLDSRNTLSLAYVKPAPHAAKYQSHLTVGLDVTSKVTLRISGGTTGVAPKGVHAVRLHSVTGETILVDPQRTPTVNLLSRKTRFVAGVVTRQVVTWSVDSLRAAPGVSITTPRAKFDPFSSGVWPLVLRPVKGTVTLDTVPATPGVSFLLEGASFSTDAKGHATAPVADLNGVDLRLSLSTDQATGSTVSLLRVSRLRPGAPFQRHLVAALAVSRPVPLTFVDPKGGVIPINWVGQVELAGGDSTVTVSGARLADPVSLLSAQAKLVEGTWTAKQVVYSVARVTVQGSDAVFAGQQRFNPNKANSWRISLSVFDVNVTVRDALFGSRVTSQATVTRPDGGQHTVKLDGGQPTLLRSLVRGQYTLTTDSAVLGASSPFLVSKNSEMELRVITLLDVVVVFSFMLLMSALVLKLGQRGQRRWTGKSQ